MPVSIQIADQYIVAHCEGELTVDDLFRLNQSLYSETDRSIAAYQIVDLTAVTRIVMSTDDIRRIADQDRSAVKSFGRITIAVVADKDLDFGMSRMWEAYAESPGIETGVFRNMSDARDWIVAMMDHADDQ
jgi:hypothetical protein